MIDKEELVTITWHEYESLLVASKFLAKLEAAGVDNWEGYAEACNMKDEDL